MSSEIYWDANFVHHPKPPKKLNQPVRPDVAPQLHKPDKKEPAAKPPKHLDGFERQPTSGSVFQSSGCKK